MHPSQAVAAPLGNATHHQEMTDHGKNSLPPQSTSHIGRIRHRRNGAKPAKWATNAATKSPTVANTVERGIAPGRMRGERGAQDRTAGGTHRLPHAYLHVSSGLSVDVLRQAKPRRTAGQRENLSALPHIDCDHIPRQRHRIQMLPADPRPARAGRAGRACRRHVGWCRHRSFPGQRGYESRHARHRVGWRFQSAGRIPRGVDGCDAARHGTDVVRWMSQHRTACGTLTIVAI